MPSTPGTINFPASLDDAVSLIEATNNASSTLTAGINASALSIPVADPAEFSGSSIATITDSLTAPTKFELVIYTSKSGSNLIVPVGGRGAFGTTAQSWMAGDFIELRPLAQHHLTNANAIIAVEAKVGAGASLPSSGKHLVGTSSGSAWTDRTYRHVQGASSNVWTVNHNLGCRPAVTAVDSSGTVVNGRIEYVNDNTLTLSFSAAFNGEAYLN